MGKQINFLIRSRQFGSIISKIMLPKIMPRTIHQPYQCSGRYSAHGYLYQRTDEIEQKIMSMYAKGMSQRDIEDTLREIYGSDISQGLISRITDKILPEVNEWQNHPLESIYPVVFFDGVVFNTRKDNRIIQKCVYSVLGITMSGMKEILGT